MTKMTSQSLLFLVIVQAALVTSASLNDPCRLQNVVSNQTLNNKPVMFQMVPENCIEGQFDWDWPQGYIYLSSTHDQPHSLCVHTTSFGSTMLGGVSDVTGGKVIPLDLPTQEHPACSAIVSGKTQLLIEAERIQLYWTTFGYRVNIY